ncbi:hypothetical protein ACIGNX_10170 [Actinosynnema sp. NPDC053489]|uniref:rhamnogalacturonan lyase family protein n=1 Tax=Actinosynnema sp. NPDC053489 TaxID=3363916 RepID=UPI0037C76E0E
MDGDGGQEVGYGSSTAVHEGGRYAPYGCAMRAAAAGEVLYGGCTGVDTGRGMVGDVVPSEPGLETRASVPGGCAPRTARPCGST